MPGDFACASCGFLVFAEPPGSYAICPVCGWEDDQVQLANPTSAGGANGISLAESQRRVLEAYPVDLKTTVGLSRAEEWRPLTKLEIEEHEQQVVEANSPWVRTGVVEKTDCYWERFYFELGKPADGWMSLALARRGHVVDFDVSDVPADSVKMLMHGLGDMLDGELSAKVTWFLEPVEVEMRIEASDGRWRLAVEQAGNGPVFFAEGSREEISVPILVALARLERTDAAGEYHGDSTWSHAFPSSLYDDLRRKL